MKKENKKIPIKNYIILTVVILLTILAVFYARNTYIMSKKYYENNTEILEVAKEIQQDELSNYLIENPKFILYIASKQNSQIQEIEKNIKKIIIENDLEDSILYLDQDNLDSQKLKQQLNTNTTINQNSIITIYIIENGQTKATITNVQDLSKGQIKQKLEKYGVIENG